MKDKTTSSDIPLWTIAVTIGNATFYGQSSVEVLEQIKQGDYSIPDSVFDYKVRMASRAEVAGFHLVFWDATSFILAAEAAGIWQVEFNERNAQGGA